MRALIKCLFLSLLFLYSCTNTMDIPLDENGNETFQAFHQKFYADSLFQLQRIEFPMIGNNPDGSTERFFWDTDNWQIIKGIDPNDPDIKQVPFFDMDGVMRERIIVQNRFMIENLFTLIDNKWYLTYYSGIHDIGYYSGKKGGTNDTEETPVTDTTVTVE